MAFVTGDVVPVSGDELPFKVVFKQGETVLTEWLVESQGGRRDRRSSKR